MEVTIMVLKVDLKCHRCYKKIKKVLCKFPQIKDQVYDEKKNTVTIKVVCCSPEKIKQKIICKAGDSLISIEIIKVVKQPPTETEPSKIAPTNENKDKGNQSGNKGVTPRSPEPVPKCNVEVEVEIELVTPPHSCPGQFRQRCKEYCSDGRPGGPCCSCQGSHCQRPQPAAPCHQCDGCCQCHWHWGRPAAAPCDRGCYLVYYEERTAEPCLIM
ncbi:protein PYRICULARIA ORYZAE RESISTANCE 21-like isoform X2 [Humulus lupulus]|uniref:protein PYRICULARIA ORYZAE RESISTANCE 21-like isoform X2 n=1 Tax=Humulus lupulus TaxID=3486 RepID=UPI002B4045B5|nr:protein PYRICULARIA ORYZAE RESISTANCE 21-like isoform X2 [Humulus lupulus]